MPTPENNTVHFNVTRDETAKFAAVWRTKGGLVSTLDQTSVAFATDWANVVIRNFMAMLAQMKAEADAKKAEEAKPKIII
jgi:hypothetical protein